MDTRNLVLPYRKHSEWVLGAQGGLVRKWELRHVSEFFEVIWVNADLVEFAAVVRDVVVRMAQFILRALGLQCDNFVARCVLNAHLRPEIVREDVERGGQGSAFLTGSIWGSTPLFQDSRWLRSELKIIY